VPSLRPVQVVATARLARRELDPRGGTQHGTLAAQLLPTISISLSHALLEWTSSVMNVQEHIEGIRGNDLVAIGQCGPDEKRSPRAARMPCSRILVEASSTRSHRAT